MSTRIESAKILTKSSMEGGRLLGSGTYGCVFTPPLLCKSEKKKEYGKVGKITADVFAQQEIQIANRIRKIPLAHQYFLLPEPESCELAPEEKQTDPNLQACHQRFQEHGEDFDLKQMTQIIQPFGGIKPFYMLSSLNLHPTKFDFFSFMRNMLEAGSILLLAGVSHFDLHPANLLVDSKKRIRILDFGMSFSTNNITDMILKGRWKRLRFGFESDETHPSVYNAEPPEVTVMNAIRSSEYTVDQAIRLTVMGKEVFQSMEKYLSISKTQSEKEMRKFWTTSDFAKKRDFLMLWKIYWPGFDAWSIGCLIMDILKSLLLLPEFTQGPYRTKKAAVLATLRGLLNPNPRDRLDCIEALALFDPGSAWIERFGKAWLLTRKRQRKI
jgi:serine/threonine protein kinase